MKYKCIVFDMDGTILDTLEDLTDSVNYALKTCGYPERTIDEVRFFVGNGIQKLIERAVPVGSSQADIQKVFETFMPYYKLHSADKTKPYDGIPEAIKELRAAGLLTAVVSNKADPAVQILVEQYFKGLFDSSLGESPAIAKKPARDMVDKVLSELGIAPEKAIYIGDSDVDVETAKNSGLDGLFVEWGFRSREFLLEHGAVDIVANTKEMVDFLLNK